ncbi:YkgJ family cysteine cluster protein [Psychrosphaera sp. 1_MG-2023]|uniref:YkgJ family cysteine cluster protein n=1 Tax=Psychrosphaera sp. 1_MG-2023 TaxID=3062643 RepID=UPI0026E3A1C3|nr:YkgJ family cysteine cluster protein [Psychrosphaera sp. 1_MG-2023]MDO6719432.1 YkgJ family cysteine cluster protein [Psychrosphaera sp. 1_MG-2023]
MKDCNQCGKCCIKYGDGALSATQDEIDLWEIFNPEIFEFVKNDDIWFDPISGQKLTRCPFLEVESNADLKAQPPTQTKYTCSIYQNRPEDCRHYPSLIAEMIRDECEMIEITDLDKPIRAQQKLDILMQDSRPPSGTQR